MRFLEVLQGRCPVRYHIHLPHDKEVDRARQHRTRNRRLQPQDQGQNRLAQERQHQLLLRFYKVAHRDRAGLLRSLRFQQALYRKNLPWRTVRLHERAQLGKDDCPHHRIRVLHSRTEGDPEARQEGDTVHLRLHLAQTDARRSARRMRNEQRRHHQALLGQRLRLR